MTVKSPPQGGRHRYGDHMGSLKPWHIVVLVVIVLVIAVVVGIVALVARAGRRR